MHDDKLYTLLRSTRVTELIEAYKQPLEPVVRRVMSPLVTRPGWRYIRTSDRRVTDRYITCSYLGESLRDVITDLENEHPIQVCFNPTPEGGYEVSLEYKADESVRWIELLGLAPVAFVLAQYWLSEDETLRGKLQEEVMRLIERYVPAREMRMLENPELHLTMNQTYAKGSGLWTVMESIIERYNLVLDISSDEETGGLVVQMSERRT